MPVGLGIGTAVAGIGGAVIGSNATKKAADKASNTAAQTTSENNALARDIYSQNRGVLDPYVQRGNAAGSAFNELLGLGPSNNRGQAPAGALAAYGQDQGSPMAQNGYYGGGDYVGNMRYDTQIQGPGVFFDQRGGFIPAVAATPQGGQGMATQPGTAPPETSVNSAYQNYLNSSGYQFRFGEGTRALNTNAAANGLSNSGAASKALVRYGQDYGSNEFSKYLGYLSNQQGVGLSAGSALAGVGQNYAGMVTANNNSAGTAAANAALMQGSSTANMWGGIGNSLGTLAGTAYSQGWWK